MKKMLKIALIFTMLLSAMNFITKPVSADYCDFDDNDPLPNWCEE